MSDLDDGADSRPRPKRDGNINREAVAGAVAVAVYRFEQDIAELRRLSRDFVEGTSGEVRRPAHLRSASENVSPAARKRVERAVERVWEQLDAEVEALIARTATEDSGAGSEADTKVRYPFAPEQLVAVMVMAVDTPRLQSAKAEIVAVCDAEAVAVDYALAYAQWRFRIPEVLAGKVLLSPAVSTFEELLAALVRLWWTLSPKAAGVGKGQVEYDEAADFASIEDLLRMMVDRRVEK